MDRPSWFPTHCTHGEKIDLSCHECIANEREFNEQMNAVPRCHDIRQGPVERMEAVARNLKADLDAVCHDLKLVQQEHHECVCRLAGLDDEAQRDVELLEDEIFDLRHAINSLWHRHNDGSDERFWAEWDDVKELLDV